MKLDPVQAADLEELRRLGEEAKDLRYSANVKEADRVRLARDGLIYRLAEGGVSKTLIARMADVHRVLVYRIKDSYPERLRRWQEQHQ